MSTRFLLQNGVKLVLLLPLLLGANDTIKALCAVGLVVSLAVDFVLYRRDKRALGEDDDSGVEHVPLPPDRNRR